MSTEIEETVLDAEPVEPAGPLPAEPVSAAERYESIDALRGFALLGILAMNIIGFAWPWAVYSDPTRGAGFSGFNRILWVVNHIFFDMKMMTLFSMLFGAGLVLMSERADRRGRSLRGLYYRRVAWLIVIGLIHSYLIWDGDILVLYGQCGLLIYPLRKLRPRTLIALGIVAMLVVVPVLASITVTLDFLKATAARADAADKAGKKPTRFEAWIQEVWAKKVQPGLDPNSKESRKEFEESLKTHRGNYAGIVAARAKDLWKGHILAFLFFSLWIAGGRMLLGMGLMKLGVFSGARSRRFYFVLMIVGYGLGLPIMAVDAYGLVQHRFQLDYKLHGGFGYLLYGSVVMALGHVGMVVSVLKAGILPGLMRRLAAVGRMALSNYLMQSLVCTTLFYGYGLRLFGTLNRSGLFAIVLAIWAVQLLLSPLWLKVFRFGPAEWLWRSLTYWRPQPLLRRQTGEPIGSA